MILLVVALIVGTIINKLIPAIGRFIWHSPRYIKQGWQMSKELCYWRRFGPKYEITSVGKIKIKANSSLYELSLPIRLNFTNRDHFNKAIISVYSNVDIRIESQRIRGQKIDYDLTSAIGETYFSLNVDESIEKQFLVNTYPLIEYKPRLGNTAYCKIKNFGIISINGITRSMKFKRKIKVEVNWE